jgi:glycogen debranching enzyme
VGAPGSGWFAGDRRILSGLVVTIDGVEPVRLVGQAVGAAHARFVGTAPSLGDPGADPTVVVERDRSVTGNSVREVITVVSVAQEPVACTVGIALACDLAPIYEVNSGRPSRPLTPEVQATTTRWRSADGVTALAVYTPPAERFGPDGALGWAITLDRAQSWSVAVEVTIVDDPLPVVVVPVLEDAAFAAPIVRSGDQRLAQLVTQSTLDLSGLLVADATDPWDQVLVAGAPWYLTLFGRDALWATRMILGLGTRLAGGTLRTLARRQGVRDDAEAQEAPGKILHELRRTALEIGPSGHSRRRLVLPPVYYGSVDATPLWISLLHDAWRWGLPPEEVEALLPALSGALGWLRDALDAGGFVRYIDASGHGLANQGWKDSEAAVQFADGRLAEPPIALCEVQAYAYAAAQDGSALLRSFGRPGADFWLDWADALRTRFRDRFWVPDERGPFPAIAVDGQGRPVDTVTSNIGHLLGTGLLDPPETAAVINWLATPDLDCGHGLRTLAAREVGYNPLGYHCGSVWPHDTAIAIRGLATVTGPARGRAESVARRLIEGLLTATPAFAGRLPELYGGHTAANGRLPVPYPGACRPQAWSAAASVVLLTSILGLSPDVPNGVLRLRPMRPSPVGELTVRGLRVAGAPLDVRLSAEGQLEVLAAPPGLTIEVA